MEIVDSYPVRISEVAKFKKNDEILKMIVKYAFTESDDKKLNVILVGEKISDKGEITNGNIKLIYPIYSNDGSYVVKNLKSLPAAVEDTLAQAGIFLPEPDGSDSWFEKA